jgi:hypothetical protein
VICPQCGAAHQAEGDTCGARFNALLALDHSRTEPWGSLHGLAFSAYTLQHPAGQREDVLLRCWLMLQRIAGAGDDPMKVAAALRRSTPSSAEEWGVPPLPPPPEPGGPYAVTIADLGSFDAASYRVRALDWARATLDRWSR